MMGASLPFQKGGSWDGGAFFITVSRVIWFIKIHGLSRSIWNKFIAAIRVTRNFRMVFNNFCYFIWGQHCSWTETNILVMICLFSYKFSLPSTFLLRSCPTVIPASLTMLSMHDDVQRILPDALKHLSSWRKTNNLFRLFTVLFTNSNELEWRCARSTLPSTKLHHWTSCLEGGRACIVWIRLQ